VKPKEASECLITVSPIRGRGLSVEVDYEYMSCGRTRTGQSQVRIIESTALRPSQSTQVYAISIHGGCDNAYYACSTPDNAGKYSAGYRCYDKDGIYYSPATGRVNLEYSLPNVPSIALYEARLGITISSVKKNQDLSIYRIDSPWKPVSCEPGGDICTQPYCEECRPIYEASGSLIAASTAYTGGDISFDVTDAVSRAYARGLKNLSLQIRGEEDGWESSGTASCGAENAWGFRMLKYLGA